MEQVVRRHEALRTRFVTIAGEPEQVIAQPDEVSLPLRLIDLSDLESDAATARLHELGAEAAMTPFDIRTGPLLRITLVRLSAEQHVLMTVIHHIVADGWSIAVMTRELSTFYRALLEGKEADLPPLPVQYADFALWQQEWLRGATLERQLSYWREQLAGLTPLELPTDRPRPALQSFAGGSIDFELPADLTAGLEALSQREGVTLYMVLVATFQGTAAPLQWASRYRDRVANRKPDTT